MRDEKRGGYASSSRLVTALAPPPSGPAGKPAGMNEQHYQSWQRRIRAMRRARVKRLRRGR